MISVPDLAKSSAVLTAVKTASRAPSAVAPDFAGASLDRGSRAAPSRAPGRDGETVLDRTKKLDFYASE
jgi:hypothetical protein